MRNKLIDIMRDINTMTLAGITTLAKKDTTLSTSDMREFVRGWGDQLEGNLANLRDLLDED